MIARNIKPLIREALRDSPVVFLHGARQTGKSTLAQSLPSKAWPARYLTLDDAGVLSAAQADPAGFLAGLDGPVILDEVQRAPGLALAIKADVDQNRRPGRFLLTGSADVLLLPGLSASLAGRMEILTLWPLSQGEIEGLREGFVDALFRGRALEPIQSAAGWPDLSRRIGRGGYPEVLSRASGARRRAWFGSYLATTLQGDVRDLANIEGLADLPRLLSLLAARTAGLLNFAELSRSIGIPQTTLKRYMGLLESTFLAQLLPAWSGNLGKRLVRSPKLILSDTGLIAHLLGLDTVRLAFDPTLTGRLLENFVIMELRKQATWSRVQPRIFHFRSSNGQETDIVLEDASGRLVGIEVKASASVGAADFKGLKALAEATASRFVRGLVLYTGHQTIPFGKNLHALPLSAIWEMAAQESG